jgi:transposase
LVVALQESPLPIMINQHGLFQKIIPHQWLADETLFSLCSRHHRLSGNPLASTTCKTLFGHRTQGSAHDLPSRVDEFAARVDHALGTADHIITGHTILPYYLPFRSATFSAEAIRAMRGPGIGALKFGLGLLTSRFRANHPLKACIQCMDSDAGQCFTPYWHRAHQLPGVWLCPIHRIPLHQSTMKATGVERFNWHLPSRAQLEALKLGNEAITSLEMMMECAVKLVSLADETHFDPASTARTYRSALREIGLIGGRGTGRLALKEIGPKYAEFVRPLREVTEFTALPALAEQAAQEVARLAYEPRSGKHPIRHLAMITWLFSDWQGFVERYKEILSKPDAHENQEARPNQIGHSSPNDERRLKIVSLITQSGLTPSAAARHVGIDTTTAMVWAASAGISTKKRPSQIKPDSKAKMVRDLRRGADKHVVAQICDVSIGSVTRLLGTEVGLREEWTRARFHNAQLAARERWINAISSNPFSGVKAVRLLEPATFAWLYRNDREWLDSQSATLNKLARGNSSKLDWDKRDSDLSQLVRETCLQIASASPGKRIKLWQIYQRTPDLKAKLAKLDRLPLTGAAIRSALCADPMTNSLLQDATTNGPKS